MTGEQGRANGSVCPQVSPGFRVCYGIPVGRSTRGAAMVKQKYAVLCLLLAASAYGQSAVNRTYYPDLKVSYLSTTPLRTNPVSLAQATNAKPSPQMQFVAKFGCRGDVDSCRPRGIEVRFILDTSTWILRDVPHTIRLVTDGKPEGWGQFRWSGVSGVAIRENDFDIRENALLIVSSEAFRQIFRAKSVEVELGGVMTFSLSPENLSAAQALFTHLAPAAKG